MSRRSRQSRSWSRVRANTRRRTDGPQPAPTKVGGSILRGNRRRGLGDHTDIVTRYRSFADYPRDTGADRPNTATGTRGGNPK